MCVRVHARKHVCCVQYKAKLHIYTSSGVCLCVCVATSMKHFIVKSVNIYSYIYTIITAHRTRNKVNCISPSRYILRLPLCSATHPLAYQVINSNSDILCVEAICSVTFLIPEIHHCHTKFIIYIFKTVKNMN